MTSKAEELTRYKNALIYGTSHPEIYMTKADELWEKYANELIGIQPVVDKADFLAALQEYGAEVRAKAAGVAREHEAQGVACSAAIERMELP